MKLSRPTDCSSVRITRAELSNGPSLKNGSRLTVVTEDDVAWPEPLSEMAGGLLEFSGRLEAEAARVIDGPPGGAPSKY